MPPPGEDRPCPNPNAALKKSKPSREDILRHALALIVQDGFQGFSMRKLAARLGIAAKTIYNFFRNQDELYLCILIKGFEQLYAAFEAAVRAAGHPWTSWRLPSGPMWISAWRIPISTT